MQIKTTMRYHFIPTRMDIIFFLKKQQKIVSVGEDVEEELDHSYITGENVKWYSHSGKQFESFFKNEIHN